MSSITNSGGHLKFDSKPFALVRVGPGLNAYTSTSYARSSKVPYNTITASNGIAWNTTDYTFTVPISGLYHFSGCIRVGREDDWVYWYVNKQGTGALYTEKLVLSHGEGGSGGFTTVGGSTMAELETTESYSIKASWKTDTTTTFYLGQTWMDIVFVG